MRNMQKKVNKQLGGKQSSVWQDRDDNFVKVTNEDEDFDMNVQLNNDFERKSK